MATRRSIRATQSRKVEFSLVLVPDAEQYNDLAEKVGERTKSLGTLLAKIGLSVAHAKKFCRPVSLKSNSQGVLDKREFMNHIDKRLADYSLKYSKAFETKCRISLETGTPEGVYYYSDPPLRWCRFHLSLVRADSKGNRVPWAEVCTVPFGKKPRSPGVETIKSAVMLSVKHPMK